MLSHMRSNASDVLAEIRTTKDLGDATKQKLKDALDAFGKSFA